MYEIILAMKTDIIVATAGNKRGCYFTAHNSLKLRALLMLTHQVKVLLSST